MAQYRKKPVVIEAIQLRWDTWNEVCEFVSKEVFDKGVYLNDETFEILPEGMASNTMGLIIKTLEGNHLARQGDYIIKGVNGEFYPCKPDIFEKTYEPVDVWEYPDDCIYCGCPESELDYDLVTDDDGNNHDVVSCPKCGGMLYYEEY